jgi:Na+/melibiose symporter-like transporter
MFSVMVGAGELYFPAFAFALGAGKTASGLVATVPFLVGGGAQLITPWAVARLRSNGRWCIWTAGVQGACVAALGVAALAGGLPVPWLFFVVSGYMAAGLASGPPWTTWIESLVPARIRSGYFARRTIWCHAAQFAAVAGAAAVLPAEGAGGSMGAFAALFLVAAAARAVSTACLASQSEPVPQPPGEVHLSMRTLLTDAAHRPARRFCLHLLATNCAVQIALPFVTSYLLGELRLPLATLSLLLAVPFAARIVALPWLGGVARRLGPRRLMWIGALAFVPAAALWPLSTHVAWIAVVQAVTGVAMAAFDLANLLLWFETTRPEERTSVMTTYTFWYSAAVVLGSAVGSVLLVTLGEGRAAFVAVFLVSAAARLLACGLLPRTAPVAPLR